MPTREAPPRKAGLRCGAPAKRTTRSCSAAASSRCCRAARSRPHRELESATLVALETGDRDTCRRLASVCSGELLPEARYRLLGRALPGSLAPAPNPAPASGRGVGGSARARSGRRVRLRRADAARAGRRQSRVRRSAPTDACGWRFAEELGIVPAPGAGASTGAVSRGSEPRRRRSSAGDLELAAITALLRGEAPPHCSPCAVPPGSASRPCAADMGRLGGLRVSSSFVSVTATEGGASSLRWRRSPKH